MAMLAKLLLEGGARCTLSSPSVAEQRRRQAQEDSLWRQLEEGTLSPVGSSQCEALEDDGRSGAHQADALKGIGNAPDSTPQLEKIDIAVDPAARPAPLAREAARQSRDPGKVRSLALPIGTLLSVHCGDGAWHRARVTASSSTSATVRYDYWGDATDTLFLPDDLELVRNLLLPNGEFIRHPPCVSKPQEKDSEIVQVSVDRQEDLKNVECATNTTTRCETDTTRGSTFDGVSGHIDDGDTDRESDDMEEEDEEGRDDEDSEEGDDEDEDDAYTEESESDDEEAEEQDAWLAEAKEEDNDDDCPLDNESSRSMPSRGPEHERTSHQKSAKPRAAPTAGTWLEVLCEDDEWRRVRVTASIGPRAWVAFDDGETDELLFPDDADVCRAVVAPAPNSAEGNRVAGVLRDREASLALEAKRLLAGESSSERNTESDGGASGSERD